MFTQSGTRDGGAADRRRHRQRADRAWSGQALALPFIAIVTDAGFNRLADVPVTFTVKQGGGTLGGQPTLTTHDAIATGAWRRC